MKYIILAFVAITASADTWMICPTPASVPATVPANVRLVRAWEFRTDPVSRLYFETRPTIPACAPFDATPAIYSDECAGYVAMTGTVADAMAELSASKAARLLASAPVEKSWPLLDAHPPLDQIPDAGASYRLDDGTNKTWWIVRQGDAIATQVSAHDAAGNKIARSINLRTGIETTINLDAITSATKWKDLADAKTSKTNKVKAVRP